MAAAAVELAWKVMEDETEEARVVEAWKGAEEMEVEMAVATWAAVATVAREQRTRRPLPAQAHSWSRWGRTLSGVQ